MYSENKNAPIALLCTDALRKVSLSYFAWLFVAVVLAIGAYAGFKGAGAGSVLPFLFLYLLIMLVHITYKVRFSGKCVLLYPDIIFIEMYTIFHLGYVGLYGIGLVPYVTEIFIYDSAIPKSMLIVTLGLIAFIFGYELLGCKQLHYISPSIRIPSVSWEFLSIVLMFFAIAVNILLFAVIGWELFRGEGRRAIIYAMEFFPHWMGLIIRRAPYLFTLASTIYALSSAFRYKKLFNSKVALGLCVTFVIFSLLQVARGSLFRFLLPLLIIRHYFVKPFKFRTLVLILSSVILLFGIMALTKAVIFDPSKMIEEVQQEFERFTWMSPILEAGSSFQIVNIVANEVPRQEPYWKGKSWFSAATHFVPFLQGALIRIGIGHWAPSEWVTVTYYGPQAAGRGFTVAAEGYLNFSYLGVFLELLFFGVFVRWIYRFFAVKPSAVRAFVFLGCLAASLNVIRNHINVVTSVWTQIFIIAVLLQLFLGAEREELIYDCSDETEQI